MKIGQQKQHGAEKKVFLSSPAFCTTPSPPPLLHALDSARKAPDAFRLAVAGVVSADRCHWRSFDVNFVEQHRFSPVVVVADIPRQQQKEEPPRCRSFSFVSVFFFFSLLSPVCAASDVERRRNRENKLRCSGDGSGRD